MAERYLNEFLWWWKSMWNSSTLDVGLNFVCLWDELTQVLRYWRLKLSKKGVNAMRGGELWYGYHTLPTSFGTTCTWCGPRIDGKVVWSLSGGQNWLPVGTREGYAKLAEKNWLHYKGLISFREVNDWRHTKTFEMRWTKLVGWPPSKARWVNLGCQLLSIVKFHRRNLEMEPSQKVSLPPDFTLLWNNHLKLVQK